MTQKVFLAIILAVCSISTVKAEEIDQCKAAQDHYIAVATSLFRDGTMPDAVEISQLEQAEKDLQLLVAEDSSKCPQSQLEQMRAMLADIKN